MRGLNKAESDALRGVALQHGYTAIRAARTPAQMEALAAELERIAAITRQVAEATRRQEGKPAAARVTPRSRKAGPGRAPSRFVRFVMEPWGKDGRERLRLYVGRGLYYDLGSPARLDIQRLGGELRLVPAAGDAGYAIMVGKAMPRAFVDGAADLVRLEPGRYAAAVRGGAIVVGERLD